MLVAASETWVSREEGGMQLRPVLNIVVAPDMLAAHNAWSSNSLQGINLQI